MRERKLLTRRNALYLGVAGIAGIAATRIGGGGNNDNGDLLALDRQNPRSFAVTGTGTLKQRAARKGIIYGADVGSFDLATNPALAKLAKQECGMLVPGFMKWDRLRPNPQTFDFALSDWYINFARQNKMLVRGHTLVWYDGMPPWFKETVNKQNARQYLEQHIDRVVGRYAGKIHSWDVVNEAIEVGDGHKNGLRKLPWLEYLGDDYIDLAFRLAAKADPKALLTYNDYGLEYDKPDDEAKRKAVLKLLERLKAKGTPVKVFGMQSHLYAGEHKLNQKKLRQFFKDIADLGLKIIITELDATDRKLPADIPTRDRIVAAAYEDYLAVALDEKAVIGVVTWGLSDRYSWLPYSEFHKRQDGLEVRGLPFDRNFKPKLAWNAMARAFDRAPKR